MREPSDDLDPGLEEQEVAKRRQRLASLKCGCGNPKDKGKAMCAACEEWEYREMVRLNPPSDHYGYDFDLE